MSTGVSTSLNIPSPTLRMFAVLGQTNPELIELAIKEKYPNDHYALANWQWLLISEGTAKTVSDNLGITEGVTGTAVVVLFTSYYGRASTQVWEWIASKMGTPRG